MPWKAYEIDDYLFDCDSPPCLVVVFHPFGYPFGGADHPHARKDLEANPPACVREAMERHPAHDPNARRVIIYDPAQDEVVDLNQIITR